MVQWSPWCQSRTQPITSPTPLLLPRASVDMVQFFFIFLFYESPSLPPLPFIQFGYWLFGLWLLLFWLASIVVVSFHLHPTDRQSFWSSAISPGPGYCRCIFKFSVNGIEVDISILSCLSERGHLALSDKWSSSPYMLYFTGKFN